MMYWKTLLSLIWPMVLPYYSCRSFAALLFLLCNMILMPSCLSVVSETCSSVVLCLPCISQWQHTQWASQHFLLFLLFSLPHCSSPFQGPCLSPCLPTLMSSEGLIKIYTTFPFLPFFFGAKGPTFQKQVKTRRQV